MGNPYEQFDKKKEANPYEKFDGENPYAKFDKKEEDDISTGDAMGKGFLGPVLNFALGANELLEKKQSKTPEGLTLSEDAAKSAAEDMARAYEQHPVATVGGALTSTVGMVAPAAALPGTVAPALAVGTQAFLSSYGGRKTELMEGDPSKRAAAEHAAIRGAGTDAVLSMAPGGVALKAASTPVKIGQRVGSGAALGYGSGAAGDVAQNAAADDSLAQVDPFSMERRVVDTLAGGAMGPLFGHTIGKERAKVTGENEDPGAPSVPTGEDAPKNMGSREIVERNLQMDQKNKEYLEYKIEEARRKSEDPEEVASRTVEEATQKKQLLLDEVAKHTAELEKTVRAIEAAEALLRGESLPRRSGSELPSSLPPRPEGDWQNTKAMDKEPVPAEEAVNADMFDVGRDEGIETTPLAVEEIEVTAPAARDVSEMDLPEIEQRITDMRDGLDTHDPEMFEKLVRRRAELEEMEQGPVPQGPIIKNASAEEAAAVKSLLAEVGLDTTRIDIDMESTKLAEGVEADAGVSGGRPDVAEIRVRALEDFKKFIEGSKKYQRWLTKASADQIAKFERMFAVAHEIGHVLLFKLIQTDIYAHDLNMLVKQYDDWKARQPGEVNQAAGVHRPMRDGGVHSEYFKQFPEFFAQMVAKNLTMRELGNTPVNRFIADVRKVWNGLRKAFGLDLGVNNMVDDFINRLIADNRNALDIAGQNIFEIESTRMSLHDALVKHNKVFDYKTATEIQNKQREESGPAHPGMPRSSSLDRALGAINTAENVIGAQGLAEDISPMGTGTVKNMLNKLFLMGDALDFGMRAVGKWGFGLQQKEGIYAKSPAIRHAAQVIRQALQRQSQRTMELMQGKTSREAWDAANGVFVTLKKLTSGDSPAAVFEKSSNLDFSAVHDVLQQGIGRYSYEESLARFGGHLTEQQRTLFNTLAKLYGEMYKMAVENANTLGKKSIIPNMKGWYPAVRRGEFMVNFRIKGVEHLAGRDEMGNALWSDLAYSQRFRTKEEAEAFIRHFENQSPEFKGHLQHDGVQEVGDTTTPQTMQDFYAAYAEQRNKLYGEIEDISNGAAPKWLLEEAALYRDANGKFDVQWWLDDRMRKLVDLQVARGGALGGHHQIRTNIPGAMGSEMFRTVGDAGQAFRDANFNSVQEYTRLMMKMEIGENIGLLLNDPQLKESHPNTMEVVQLMHDYALNNMESPLEAKGLKRMLDSIWINYHDAKNPDKYYGNKKYPKAYLFDQVYGKLNHIFYLHVLMGRPAFWFAQGSQFMWSGRSMVKDGSGPVDAMVHSVKGLHSLLTHDRTLMDGLFYLSQNSHVFSPQFIHDLNKFHILDFLQEGSKTRLVIDLLTGEKQSTAADTFSRMMSFAMLVEHYKARGLTGKELYDAAGRATDENMVQYGRQYKAPVFQKMGVIGDMVSPLATFSQAALGNMVADINHMMSTPAGRGKLRAALPFMATMAITTVMTGVIGAPLVAEYELLAGLLNKLSVALGGQKILPSFIDIVLQGDNTVSNRVLSHGAMSAGTMPLTGGEGLDISSSNRWQPIFQGMAMGEKSLLEFLPSLNWAVQQGGHFTTLAGHMSGAIPVSDAEYREAKMGVLPGWTKGLVDDMQFGATSREMVPNLRGDATVPQTDMERTAKYLGTSTIHGSVERERNYRSKQRRMAEQPRVNRLKERMADAFFKGDKATGQSLARQLATRYGLTDKELMGYLESEKFRRTVPESQRQFMGKGGTMSSAQEREYMKYEDMYGVSPFEGE